MIENKTLICNLFAGPGAGKSTVAAGLFARLKQGGFNAEYIQEYAKDKTWQGDEFSLGCQPYISAKQLWRQHRLLGKVDVAITDAPLLHGLIYPGHYTGENFEKWLVETFKQFNNLNIFLKRNPKLTYSTSGRSQTLEQSQEIDIHMEQILAQHNILAYGVEVNHDNTLAVIESLIQNQLTLLHNPDVERLL